MKSRSAPWLSLSYDLMRLGVEAQGVIALRMMRLATGGALAKRESGRMIAEKAAAAVEAQTAVALAAATGARGAALPTKALRIYRRRVRANRRRLKK
jgi:hypothetical protein